MSFKVKLHPKVTKFLDKTEQQVSDKIRKRLQILKCDNPFHYLEHYEGEKCYKFRASNHRALIDVDIKQKIVFVRYLNHKSKIYKRAK
jgi:mRNA-degrading endonuclease RelE of RelBE toxin-antitoxin system